MELTTLSTEQLVNSGMKKNNKMTGRREFCCGQLFGVVLFCIGVVGGILIGIYAYNGGPSDDVNCKNIPDRMTNRDGSVETKSTTTTATAASIQTFNYRIKNQLEEPYFDLNATMVIEEEKNLLHYIEKVVDSHSNFTGFKATYFADMGFYIDSINGQAENVTVNKWQLLNGPDRIRVGVSTYVPTDGDQVMFNFTTSG